MTFLKMNGKLRVTWRFKTKTYFTGKNVKYGHTASNLTPGYDLSTTEVTVGQPRLVPFSDAPRF